jgi:hypothetical protein
MFPASWDPTQPQQQADAGLIKKRRRTFLEETDYSAEQTLAGPEEEVPFQSGLHQTIMRRLNSGEPPPPPPSLGLDHILSRVPYKAMLENLFSNLDAEVPDVPILSKAYEETFMRQPSPGERACAMGEQCECMHIDRTAPFIGVELRLGGDPEGVPQLCVLCSRATTQKCFYDMCYLGKPVKGVIQRYGSIFGQPGEYAAECMLVCPRALGLASMPVPSVSHQRNRYAVVVHGGAKHLKQQRVAHEDFQHPSSTAGTV